MILRESSLRITKICKCCRRRIDKCTEDVADIAVGKLRQNSPKKTGGYRKGWRKKKLIKPLLSIIQRDN